MKGEEVARGPTVQALYQARLRTLLFSLRLFCFLATILGMGRRDGSEGCQVEGGQGWIPPDDARLKTVWERRREIPEARPEQGDGDEES